MRLRPATQADFPYIRALMQRPDYAAFVADEDDLALAAHLQSPSTRLLIWETDHDAANRTPAGVALYCEIGDPSGRVELRRLALGQAGQGQGVAFLADLCAYAFNELAASRLWLDASAENLRAQRAYIRAGFSLEGRLRAHWFRPALGRSVDLLLYGMLRDDWLAR